MLIEKAGLNRNSLKDEVAIITGAGRGIGYEATKALVWLGAKVVIAEINQENGKTAEENINRDLEEKKALFIRTDVGEQKDIDALSDEVLNKFGKVDIVLNNATVFPIGAVKDMPIESWDFSYNVNLRGPVLLA